jgi:ribulose-5-phosphate 4-epimerase/fuculose-1-phosphate aldolase
MPYATSITLLENGRLDMIEQNALLFDGRISYDDEYEGLALAEDEGNRLAQKIGNKSILFMASHGVVIAGPTVADAFNDLYYLERAAMFQVLAKSQGGKLRTISDRVRDEIKKQYATEAPKLADRHFTALRRVLDKVEPSYRH